MPQEDPSGADAGVASTIQLDSMSLEELHQLKQQEEARLQALNNRLGAFREASVRLNQSVTAVSDLGGGGSTAESVQKNEGKEVMVPLTESVYVPGKIRESNKLLVEIGTGYFLEKSRQDTLGFLERKQKLVEANAENVSKALQASRHNIEAITVTMQGKILEIRAKQEGARHKSAVEN